MSGAGRADAGRADAGRAGAGRAGAGRRGAGRGGVDWRLYLVTDPHLAGGRDEVPRVVGEAVLGGVGVVQIRDKEVGDDEFAERAAGILEAVERAADEAGRTVPVFVNDRLDVAAELGLHLHIGQHDVPFPEARRTLPAQSMLGLSIENDAQLVDALAAPGGPPDVVGVSPVWATPTKLDAADALGPVGADRIAGAAAAGGVVAVGIGGVNASNVGALAATALDGVCVVSAIMAARDPRAAAAGLLAGWELGLARER